MSRLVNLLLLALALALLPGEGLVSAQAPTWRDKVDPSLLAEAQAGATVFLVWLDAQADLSSAVALATKTDKAEFVVGELTAVAHRTQTPIRQLLDQRGISYRPFWITNMLAVRGDAALIETLARRADVARIAANRPARFAGPVDNPFDAAALPLAVQATEWGVRQINADDVWQLGYTGQGVVVAGQDTGYQWDHPALISQYRGWDGGTATHDYNWHDAIHAIIGSGTNPCGLDAPAPCDDHNHGTHTMGTMVGDDGLSNQIGVAPGAQWIACRNMERGNGTPATYAECFEWFVAPTDLAGANPDPAKAPHVVNNSWGCPPSEGCTDPAILQSVVENTRAAGIVVVASAGNAGSACATVQDPAAIYDAAFSVAATDSSDNAASFSSRGPVTVDGSQRFKPDIAAPGVSVRSSIRNGGYSTMSGTSMAGPHVAGLVALLISADPALAGQVDKIEMLVRNTAVPRTTTQNCGALPGGQSPNHTFGYGRIDALAAVNYALNPPAATAVATTISTDAAGVRLDWLHDRANCQYAVHRSPTPYFTPAGSTQAAQLWGDVTHYSDATAVAPGGSAFYQVAPIGCDGVAGASGGETAVFNFALAPGEG
jgi:serine protease AprX